MSIERRILNKVDDYPEIVRRIQKNGIILDTCVLLLLLVGQYSPASIKNNSRLQKYNEMHFYILQTIIESVEKNHTTAYILPEISNLVINRSKEGADGGRQYEYAQNLLGYFKNSRLAVTYPEISSIIEHDSFALLGATDVSILDMALKKEIVVITDDYSLYSNLHAYGGACLLMDELPVFQKTF